MKRWQALLLGLIISAGALYIATRGIQLGRVIEIIAQVRFGYVLATSGLLVIASYLRGLTWSTLLQGRISARRGFWLFGIGALFNNVLPFRMGEFARAYIAARQPDLRFAEALSSIVVERLADLLSIVIFLGILLQLPGLSIPQWASSAALLMAATVLAAIVLLHLAARHADWVLQSARRLLPERLRSDNLLGQARSFLDGLEALRQPRIFLTALTYSFGAWVIAGLAAWVLLLAFDEFDQPGVEIGFLAVAAAGLGIAVPSLPGAIGPFEAAVRLALVAVGFGEEVALSYALVLHAVNYVTTSLLGALGLVSEGMKFGEVASAARQRQESQTSEAIVEG